MGILSSYLERLNFGVSPIQLGEIIIIVAILVLAMYIFHSLNLFKKQR